VASEDHEPKRKTAKTEKSISDQIRIKLGSKYLITDNTWEWLRVSHDCGISYRSLSVARFYPDVKVVVDDPNAYAEHKKRLCAENGIMYAVYNGSIEEILNVMA